MPQLLNCSSQLFFLLYLILFSSYFIFCDLQRGKTCWPMVQSHSDPAVIRVTDVLLFSCPVTWVGRSAALGAESYQYVQTLPWPGELHCLPFHDNFLQCSQLKFEHILEGVLELHLSLCLLSLWPGSLPGSHREGCSLQSMNIYPVHPCFSELWGALLSARTPLRKLGILEMEGRTMNPLK